MPAPKVMNLNNPGACLQAGKPGVLSPLRMRRMSKNRLKHLTGIRRKASAIKAHYIKVRGCGV